MIGRLTAALLLATLLGTAAVGCGPESRVTGPTAEPSVSVEATQPTDDTSSEIPPSATNGASGLDAAGVDAELGAMERELDQMEMPSDADFTGAEGALY